VDQISKLFSEHDELIILFTPEGTRKYSPKWKRGFYFAAKEANVPIVLGYVDYGKKLGGILPVAFETTDDVDADIERIKDFYRPFKGLHPDQGIR
jgi:1-acyl-sn-glycerol-3-phosphate acyltransferase